MRSAGPRRVVFVNRLNTQVGLAVLVKLKRASRQPKKGPSALKGASPKKETPAERRGKAGVPKPFLGEV
jgi:hypothetical protein